ncbi:MAG TPA: SMC family ATPase, partial [Candidatus Paceibacterota bacterium]|nr:SMC family ATPase [Candidatus Paceibacterota bacterium]
KENYSVEKLSQIEKFIKDRYGCESVSADYQSIEKEVSDLENVDSADIDVNDAESAEKLLLEFLEQNNHDNIEDVIELSREIDKKLDLKQNPTQGKRIEFNSMEVSNLLSFSVEPTNFDFDKLNGITGIFGENYNGKSNIMKVFCWIAYGKMPGDLDSSKIVNMYTGNNKGWGKISFTIAGVKYYAYRAATVKKKKDGTPEVSYNIEYKKYSNVVDELTGEEEMKWVSVESDEAATEKKEKKKLIVDYIGTYEDFMVCSMQVNGEDYLSLKQQPKNDLINKFLGLEIYRDKYDHANEVFKTIKSKQKFLGDPAELETQIADFTKKSVDENVFLAEIQKEKEDNNKVIDDLNKEIIDLTKKLHKIEVPKETNVENIKTSISSVKSNIEKEKSILDEKELWIKDNYKKELSDDLKSLEIDSIKEKNVDIIKSNIEKTKTTIEAEKTVLKSKEEWLEKNFKKELQENLKNLDKGKVEKELNSEKQLFASEKEEYVKIEEWIKTNDIKIIKPDEQELIEVNIANFRLAIAGLEDKIKIAKGEKCPTCSHVSHEPNPTLEKKCKDDLERGKKALADAQKELETIKSNIEHNATHEKKTTRLASLKDSMQSRHKNITTLKSNLELSSQKEDIVKHNSAIDDEAILVKSLKESIDLKEKEIIKLQGDIEAIEKYAKKKDIVEHNNKVDSETVLVNTIKNSIELKNKEISQLEEQIVNLEKNKTLIIENEETNEAVKIKTEEIKTYKVVNLQADSKIKESSGNIGAWKNNIENLTDKLNAIRDTDKIYKKYSVYIQAVGRDGIPAIIIRKKLPIINHKINNLLKSMVSFKVEMFIKPNGDVKEMFYFSENKMDTLPIGSGSGSIKFIASTAISDALHFVSSLIKPSLKVIDEGFDTLDNKKLVELNTMFSYLKSKYKNLLIVTHKSEVRDYVDNIIEVKKVKDGITDPDVLANPEAGISKFIYS